MKNVDTFGERLRELREAVGWSINKLSRRTGGSVSAIQVSRLERGLTTPKWDTVRALARAFGLGLGLLDLPSKKTLEKVAENTD